MWPKLDEVSNGSEVFCVEYFGETQLNMMASVLACNSLVTVEDSCTLYKVCLYLKWLFWRQFFSTSTFLKCFKSGVSYGWWAGSSLWSPAIQPLVLFWALSRPTQNTTRTSPAPQTGLGTRAARDLCPSHCGTALHGWVCAAQTPDQLERVPCTHGACPGSSMTAPCVASSLASPASLLLTVPVKATCCLGLGPAGADAVCSTVPRADTAFAVQLGQVLHGAPRPAAVYPVYWGMGLVGPVQPANWPLPLCWVSLTPLLETRFSLFSCSLNSRNMLLTIQKESKNVWISCCFLCQIYIT